MRICLYTPTFLPVMGGAELFCDMFARGMQGRGHEVVVIALKQRTNRPMPEVPYPVRRYRRPPCQHLCTEILAWPLLKAWRKHHFDVVVTIYGYPLAYAVSRVKERLKLGLIAVAQGADLYPTYNPRNKWRVNRLIAEGYRRSDHVVGVSRTMAERARAFMGKAGPVDTPVDVIHNAIDIGAWERSLEEARGQTPDVVREFGLVPGGFTLQVAGLRQVKRPDLAIDAVARCRDVYEKLNLRHVMAGEGKTAEQYHALARGLGIADRIVFAGVRTGMDKYWLFAHARLLMHTSDEEGLPFVLSEAAASGLPMLVSGIDPHREFLGDSGCGRTFHRGDLEDLAGRLREMLGGDLTALRAASRRRAVDFGADKMLDAYEALCRRVMTIAQGASA